MLCSPDGRYCRSTVCLKSQCRSGRRLNPFRMQAVFFTVYIRNLQNVFTQIFTAAGIDTQCTLTWSPLGVQCDRSVVSVGPGRPVPVIRCGKITYLGLIRVGIAASVRCGIPPGKQIADTGIIVLRQMGDRSHFATFVNFRVIIHMIAFPHKSYTGSGICICIIYYLILIGRNLLASVCRECHSLLQVGTIRTQIIIGLRCLLIAKLHVVDCRCRISAHIDVPRFYPFPTIRTDRFPAGIIVSLTFCCTKSQTMPTLFSPIGIMNTLCPPPADLPGSDRYFSHAADTVIMFSRNGLSQRRFYSRKYDRIFFIPTISFLSGTGSPCFPVRTEGHVRAVINGLLLISLYRPYGK